MLKQSVPEGLHPMEGTYAGVHEVLPLRRKNKQTQCVMNRLYRTLDEFL